MTQQFLEALKFARKYELNYQNPLKTLSFHTIELYEASSDKTEDVLSTIQPMLQHELQNSVHALASFKKEDTSWPLKTNKMSDFIIPECINFFDDSDKAYNLLKKGIDVVNSKLDVGEKLPLLSYNESESTGQFWGTSKPTFLAAKLTYAYLGLQDIVNPETASSISAFSSQSPLHHVVKCDIVDLPKSKLIYDVKGERGYGFIHGGYAFGGGRETSHKELAPRDCSSFLKIYFLAPSTPEYSKIEFSTIDLAYAHGYHTRTCDISQIESWLSGPENALVQAFTPIEKLEDVEIGDVWVIRKGCDASNPFGKGGHTGFVSQTKGAGLAPDEIEILALSRNMPNMEGYGLQHVPKISSDLQDGTFNKVMYLRPQYRDEIKECGYSPKSIIRTVDRHMTDHPEEYALVLGDSGATEE